MSCTRSGHEVLLNKHIFSAWLSPVVFDQATSVCALSCTAVVFCLEDADVLTYCLDSERVDGGICTCKSLSLPVFGSLLFWHYKLSPVLREWEVESLLVGEISFGSTDEMYKAAKWLGVWFSNFSCYAL